MAKHDVQNVSYMRKDTHFLADGIWYVSTPCPVCGLVDEAVPWDEAKTPHHAGLIADQRHLHCARELDDVQALLDRENEIEAAEQLLRDQVENFKRARERVAFIAALPDDHPLKATRGDVQAAYDRHEKGMAHAARRVEEMRKANRPE